MENKNKKVDNNNSKNVEKNNSLTKDDICFLCDFLENNIDLAENKEYYEELIAKLEEML